MIDKKEKIYIQIQKKKNPFTKCPTDSRDTILYSSELQGVYLNDQENINLQI